MSARIPRHDVMEILAKLPPYCFSVLNSDERQLIRINRGEMGYYPVNVPQPDGKTAKQWADDMNSHMSVTKAQVEAMESGSMFGWEIPAADPDLYSEDGTINHSKLKE